MSHLNQANQAIIFANSFEQNFDSNIGKPVPLFPLLNIPLIDYTIDILVRSDVNIIYIFCSNYSETIKEYVSRKQWQLKRTSRNTESLFVSFRFIVCKTVDNVGDVLRRLYNETNIVIEKDFIICQGNIIGRFDLEEALLIHRQKQKKNKNFLMTSITHECKNTNINICSTEILSIFNENFDYESLDVLSDSEILGYKISTHNIKDGQYSISIKSLYDYFLVSKEFNDISNNNTIIWDNCYSTCNLSNCLITLNGTFTFELKEETILENETTDEFCCFESDIYEIINDALDDSIDIDNICIAIKSRKFAYDKTFFDCVKHIIRCILDRKFTLKNIKNDFSKLSAILKKIIQSEDQVEIIWSVQEYFDLHNIERLDIFPFIVHHLYELELIDEDSILEWAIQQEENNLYLLACDKLIKWLKTDD